MGWKENRRRKRTWYQHYRNLASALRALMNETRAGQAIAPEAILKIMFDAYERRRLHGKRFIADSAYDSMLLACRDEGLSDRALAPLRWARGERPPEATAGLPLPRTPPPTSAGPVDLVNVNRALGIDPAAGFRVNEISFVGGMTERRDVPVDWGEALRDAVPPPPLPVPSDVPMNVSVVFRRRADGMLERLTSDEDVLTAMEFEARERRRRDNMPF